MPSTVISRLAATRLATTARLMSTTSFPKPPPLGPSQAGQVADQGPPKIHLWTAGTPNGYKVSILLEELRAAYPELAKTSLSYDVSAIEIWGNAQKVGIGLAALTPAPRLSQDQPERAHPRNHGRQPRRREYLGEREY